MQEAETPQVEEDIQRALADESATELRISSGWFMYNEEDHPPPLTVIDSQCIIECLRQTPPVDTLRIHSYDIQNPAVLNVLRDGLPLCTSITTVILVDTQSGNEDLYRLRTAFYNNSVTILGIHGISTNDRIQGRRGGEVLRDLLVGNDTLRELIIIKSHMDWNNNDRIGPEVAIGFGQGLTDNHGLQILSLQQCNIGNDGLANLLPANGIINNSLLDLNLDSNDIEGEDGGRQVTLLLQHFPALKVLDLGYNRRLGPLGARALAPGLAAARHLETLKLWYCGLGNDGVANLILPDGQENRSLTHLKLRGNDIQGEDGGRQVTLLLQRFTALKVLNLYYNDSLGPLGARALAPGLAAARQLESLELWGCGLGNDGVANLVPDGQVNRSLTSLNIGDNNIYDSMGGENVISLVSRCTNLNRLGVSNNRISPEQRRRLDLLLDQNRLCTEASALGGSTFPVLFRFVEKAHRHEQGLSAIFVILQNDGDDYFCTALNRAI